MRYLCLNDTFLTHVPLIDYSIVNSFWSCKTEGPCSWSLDWCLLRKNGTFQICLKCTFHFYLVNDVVYWQVLHDAFTRCVSVLSKSSSPDDLAVQVCTTKGEGERERERERFSICERKTVHETLINMFTKFVIFYSTVFAALIHMLLCFPYWSAQSIVQHTITSM